MPKTKKDQTRFSLPLSFWGMGICLTLITQSCVSSQPRCKNLRMDGKYANQPCNSRSSEDTGKVMPSKESSAEIEIPESDKKTIVGNDPDIDQEWDCKRSEIEGQQRWTCDGNSDIAYRCKGSPGNQTLESWDCKAAGQLCLPRNDSRLEATCGIE